MSSDVTTHCSPLTTHVKIANIMMGGKVGGVEQALLDTSEALRAQGHEVTAFIRAGAALLPPLMQARIPTVSLAMPYRWNLGGRFKLGQRLSTHDLILLHGNRAGELTRGLRNLPPILAVVHSRFFKPQPHFTALLALSPERAKELNTPYVAPNMVRLPAYTPRGPFRNPPVIGAMGRLSEEKGFDLLIDAFALLRQRGIAFHALIAGVGGQEATLRKRIAQHQLETTVELIGWVADKAAFFARLDMFVLSSRTENFPITLLEAMAHGCPTIATRCGGPQTIITEETNGYLTDIAAAAIAETLTHALGNETATRALGEAARTHAAQHYTMEVVGKQLSDIATKVAAAR